MNKIKKKSRLRPLLLSVSLHGTTAAFSRMRHLTTSPQLPAQKFSLDAPTLGGEHLPASV
jgi:hypothetical protein